MTKRSESWDLIVPTAAKDAAIDKGILQGQDTVEMTAADMAALKPWRLVGRPSEERALVPRAECVELEGAGGHQSHRRGLTIPS